MRAMLKGTAGSRSRRSKYRSPSAMPNTICPTKRPMAPMKYRRDTDCDWNFKGSRGVQPSLLGGHCSVFTPLVHF